MSSKPETSCRALALDLDGTVLNEGGTLDSHVTDILEEIRLAGIPVYLMTGRMVPAALPIWKALGLSTPLTSYNGARIGIPGEALLHDARLDDGLTERVLPFAMEKGWQVNIYTDDQLYAVEESDALRWYSEHFRVPYTLISQTDRELLRTPTKVLVIVDETDVEETYAELTTAFRAEASFTTSSKRFVEILPLETNKGNALQMLAAHVGIPCGQWWAAGDGCNDMEMLQVAGAGIAIENGAPALLGIADAVLPPLPDGGAELLRDWLLRSAHD